MRRITALILILLLLCGCSLSGGNDNAESHAQITINLPSDNTVNGYRESDSSSSMPDTIPADEVKPESSSKIGSSVQSNSSTQGRPSVESNSSVQSDSSVNSVTEYIGNLKSHIFHKSSCGSVGTMKEENKVALKSRDEALSSGYSPCKRCNP